MKCDASEASKIFLVGRPTFLLLPMGLMSQKHLNYLVLIHTHQQHTDGVNLLDIAKQFTSRNSQGHNCLVTSATYMM